MTDIDLAQFDDAFAKAEAPEKKAFDAIPDGTYKVSIYNLSLTLSKSTNLPMIAFEFKITEGPFANRKLYKNSVVKNDTLQFLKKDLALIGFTGQLSTLRDQEVRHKFFDRILEVGVKNTGKDANGRANTNIYINKLLSSPTANAPKTDEEVPF